MRQPWASRNILAAGFRKVSTACCSWIEITSLARLQHVRTQQPLPLCCVTSCTGSAQRPTQQSQLSSQPSGSSHGPISVPPTILHLAGAMQRTPFSAATHVQSMPEVEAVQLNSTTQSLCGVPWEQLLSIVGDAAMLLLLLHTTLFQALPNGCFLQLTGVPAPKVQPRLPHLSGSWLARPG